jgi:hypothetical protein
VAAGATTENSARPSFSRAHNRKSNAREIIGYRKGGANTHFFHAHASIRKEAEPHIQAAQRQNVVVTDQEEMQALATTHYVDLSMTTSLEYRQHSQPPMISTQLTKQQTMTK